MGYQEKQQLFDEFDTMQELGIFDFFKERVGNRLSPIRVDDAFDEYLDEEYDLSDAGDIFRNINPSEVLKDFDSMTYEDEQKEWLEQNESMIQIDYQYYWIDDVFAVMDEFDTPEQRLYQVKKLINELHNTVNILFHENSTLIKIFKIVNKG